MATSFLSRKPDSGLGNIKASPADPTRNIDWLLLGAQVLLTIIGCFIVFSTSRTRLDDEWYGRSGISIYADGMLEHDRDVGRILDKLDELGIADNTIFLFFSDHGDFTGDYGLVLPLMLGAALATLLAWMWWRSRHGEEGD